MTNKETQKFINERIEALKLELESKYIRVTKEPEFEEGVWYCAGNGYGYGLFSKKGSFNKGFVNEIWYDNIGMIDVSDWQKVTDFTELKELLKKEAVKRGMVEGAKLNKNRATTNVIKYPLRFDVDFGLFVDANYNTLMDSDGTWAEVVKEKTTEEWLREYQYSKVGMYDFFKQNNLEITQKK